MSLSDNSTQSNKQSCVLQFRSRNLLKWIKLEKKEKSLLSGGIFGFQVPLNKLGAIIRWVALTVTSPGSSRSFFFLLKAFDVHYYVVAFSFF